MRKTFLGAASAAALLSASFAAPASASTVHVDGDRFGKSGLRVASHGCDDTRAQPAEQPTIAIKRGPGNPPLGDHSVGWTMPGTSFGVGPTSHVGRPSKLTTLRISVYAPDHALDGRAVATYHAPNDDGVWRGIAHVGPSTASGWTTVKASQATYTWNHFTGSVIDNDPVTLTLPDMATSHGGDGRGAEVGFLFGCSGETFYLDNFEASTKSQSKVYDLGGYLSLSDITWGYAVRKKIAITYGQRLGLTARLRELSDSTALDGTLRVDAKSALAKHWSKFDQVKAGDGFKVQPARSTSYRTMFAGSEKYEHSTWRPLKVMVRSVVNAGLADSTVTKGKTFTARGRVLPGRTSKVALQRFIKKRWTTVKAGRSGKDGRYRISFTAKSLGTSYWRVLASSGNGNLGNHSNQMKLTVTKPASSGGGGGGTYDPPPPPDDPPPPTEPPPPSH